MDAKMDMEMEMKDGEDQQSLYALSDFHFFLDFDDQLRKIRRMRMRKDDLWPFQSEDIQQTSSSSSSSSSSKTLMEIIHERESSNCWTKLKMEGEPSGPPLDILGVDSPTANNIITSSSSSLNHDSTHFPIPLPQHISREGVCMKQKGGEKEEKEEGEPIMFVVESEVEVLYDGYSWRKYGEKNIKNRIYPRVYYRCGENGCKMKKHVERSTENPLDVLITYYGRHSHAPHF